MISFSRYRRPILLAGGAVYLAGAGASYYLSTWWPLPVSLGLAYLLYRAAGSFDPLSPSSYGSFAAFLASLEKDSADDARNRQTALRRAAGHSGIAAVLRRHGKTIADLDGIEVTLSRFGLGKKARRVVGDPKLLERYFELTAEADQPGWTEEDGQLYIATKLGELV